ncbi:MAG: hypothetical protein ABUJ98_11780 [Hyphomicrobium sp.]|jgi:hypothetical protein
MSNESRQQIAEELQQTLGALDVLFTLREEFATWVEEARDESSKEALENVQRRVVDVEAEFQRRREEAEKKLKAR